MGFKEWLRLVEDMSRRGFLGAGLGAVTATALGTSAELESPKGDLPFPSGSGRNDWKSLAEYIMPYSDQEYDDINRFLRFVHSAPEDITSFRGQLLSQMSTRVPEDDVEGKRYLANLLRNKKTGQTFKLPAIDYAPNKAVGGWNYQANKAVIGDKTSPLGPGVYGRAAHELTHGLQTQEFSHHRSVADSTLQEVISVLDGIRELYHDRLRRRRMGKPPLTYQGEVVFPSGVRESIENLVRSWGQAGPLTSQPLQLLNAGKAVIHNWIYNKPFETRYAQNNPKRK